MRGYEGHLSLDQLQTQIRFEEAGSLELFDCVTASDKNNKPLNVCKFNELPPGDIPKDIFLVVTNSPKPAGATNKVLTDTVIVNNQFTTVDFYR
ncbi:hypothetical protein RO575_19935 [Methylomonas sp. MO1]|uniref:hypothetical protein n=1 Tax=Methylomonas sp. MO1 TaxID=3073619 RepID=UPI0028A483A5|nr:hypothetical protein [Methylomonas sp. MO1]MDT4291841.1 hypothetical protein [Methylomonas sp. MO1]